MFPSRSAPRLYALAPGIDYPAVFARGLYTRFQPLSQEVRARTVILVNSARMRHKVQAELAAIGPGLLPRIRLVTDPWPLDGPDLPPPAPPLRRLLDLSRLIDALMRADPAIAPRAALFDLSRSLASLMSELQAEGVDPARLAGLDLSPHAAHWQRAARFLHVAVDALRDDAPDPEARLRAQVLALSARWAICPPPDPVLVAGSTGSRGTTFLLMQAVARLPQGAVILPGYDFDMPLSVWNALDEPDSAQDHPQFRYRRLMRALDLQPSDITPWTDDAAPDPARNRVLSLALRPAPVTDQWTQEGAKLPELPVAMSGVALLEAPGPRAEALAIAHILLQARHEGKRAALVTPDRMLTRRVAAALDRWRILPDDSAGRPLALSAPGRFLRHVADLMAGRVDALGLVTLLQHPLTHSGRDRGAHLLHARELELHLRAGGLVWPQASGVAAWAGARGAVEWGAWVARLLELPMGAGLHPFEGLVARHVALAEQIARGAAALDGSGELWLEAAGQDARALMEALARDAGAGAPLSASDYAAFVAAFLQTREVREAFTSDPCILFRGTLEARVQDADLVVLGGLNDGIWPAASAPDPWLNRRLRLDLGLPVPERQVGLAAHDFQQAACAPRVVLSRALRDDSAPTIPSRWLNRLTNLLQGLPGQGGDVALQQMQARGQHWLRRANAFDARTNHLPADPPALRPAPVPPLRAIPRQLSVTRISRLVRNPYEIYARHVLRLKPLAPLHPVPDAALRGTVLHRVLELYLKLDPPPDDRAQALLAIAEQVLAQDVPWPAARLLMQARMSHVARGFLAFQADPRGNPVIVEEQARLDLSWPAFTLTAKADRIDLWPDGCAHVIDYKTGTPPSTAQQKQYDKQLLLQALMVSEGAWPDLGPREVARTTYLGLGPDLSQVDMSITPGLLDQTRQELCALLDAYLHQGQGFTARRLMFSERDQTDYDHLSRYGEWLVTDDPVRLPVGDHGDG